MLPILSTIIFSFCQILCPLFFRTIRGLFIILRVRILLPFQNVVIVTYINQLQTILLVLLLLIFLVKLAINDATLEMEMEWLQEWRHCAISNAICYVKNQDKNWVNYPNSDVGKGSAYLEDIMIINILSFYWCHTYNFTHFSFRI